mgnify:CR=1 FL=1
MSTLFHYLGLLLSGKKITELISITNTSCYISFAKKGLTSYHTSEKPNLL